MEEGTKAEIPPQEFGLVVGEPTRFRFFSSSVRRDDPVGAMLDDPACPRPAAIIGCPVGFVGAAESKDMLAADSRGVPYVIVRGRRGGSAMAAAAVNALATEVE